MHASPQQMLSDLINQPGLGMFAWMCFVFFFVAGVFFVWALKSGQLDDLESSKLEIFDDEDFREVPNV